MKATVYHFGRCVERAAAEGVQKVVRGKSIAESKIHNLNVATVVQKQILRLKIAMHYLGLQYPQVQDISNLLGSVILKSWII